MEACKKKTGKILSKPFAAIVTFLFFVTIGFFLFFNVNWNTVGLFVLFLVCVSSLIFLFLTFQVDTNHIARRKLFGNWIGNQVGQGLHFKFPLEEVEDKDSSVSPEQDLSLGELITPEPENGTFKFEKSSYKFRIVNLEEYSKVEKSLHDSIKKIIAEAIQGFINDSKNPPNTYDEFIKIPNKKLVARIIAQIENRDWPRHGTEYGFVDTNKDVFLSDSEMEEIERSTAQLEGNEKKTPLTDKRRDLTNAQHLINGNGLFELSVPNSGMVIRQLSLLKPVPTGEFKEKINERMQEEQNKKIEDKKTVTERARRNKELVEYQTLLMRMAPLIEAGSSISEAFRFVCIIDPELSGRLSGITREYVVKLEGSSEKVSGELLKTLEHISTATPEEIAVLAAKIFNFKPTGGDDANTKGTK